MKTSKIELIVEDVLPDNDSTVRHLIASFTATLAKRGYRLLRETVVEDYELTPAEIPTEPPS